MSNSPTGKGALVSYDYSGGLVNWWPYQPERRYCAEQERRREPEPKLRAA